MTRTSKSKNSGQENLQIAFVGSDELSAEARSLLGDLQRIAARNICYISARDLVRSRRANPFLDKAIGFWGSKLPRFFYIIVEAPQNLGVVEDLWSQSETVILLVDQFPEDEATQRLFHRAIRFASVLLFSSEESRDAARKASHHTGTFRPQFVLPHDSGRAAFLHEMSREAAARQRQEEEDRRVILKSGLFKTSFAYPWLGRRKVRAVAESTTSWRNGINRRKPFPGFHPGVYADECRVEDRDPLAHYLSAGCPEGPWKTQVVRSRWWNRPAASRLRTALHVHLFYPDWTDEIVRAIGSCRSRPDLFISVPSERAAEEAREKFSSIGPSVLQCKVVPNRGRDIGPMLTAFREELQSYEVVGHIHSKRSIDYSDRRMVDLWIRFLLGNLLGGKDPMMDVILDAFAKNENLGIVFAHDPHVIGWMGNRSEAEKLWSALAAKTALPTNDLNFPVGNMFWARTRAMKPLFDFGFSWEDYPNEPVPADGTILHAIERLLPFIAEGQQYKTAVTSQVGLQR